MSDARDHAGRLKRGAGHQVLSLDAELAEGRYHLDPADVLDPEKIFEVHFLDGLLGLNRALGGGALCSVLGSRCCVGSSGSGVLLGFPPDERVLGDRFEEAFE